MPKLSPVKLPIHLLITVFLLDHFFICLLEMERSNAVLDTNGATEPGIVKVRIGLIESY